MQGNWSNILTRSLTIILERKTLLNTPRHSTSDLWDSGTAFSRWQTNLVMRICCFKPIQPKPVSLIDEISSDLGLLPSSASLAISLHTPHTPHTCFIFHSDSHSLSYSNPTCSHHQAIEHTAFSVWCTLSSTSCLTAHFRCHFLWVMFLDFCNAGLAVVLCAPVTSSA